MLEITYSGFPVHILVWQFQYLGGNFNILVAPKLILTRRKNLGSAILDVLVEVSPPEPTHLPA